MKGRRVLRILVVEDEPLIAMEIEAVLETEGHAIAATVPTVAAALAYLKTERPDAALLDANLRGEPSVPIADELTRQHVPFLVLTGHSPEALPERLRPFFVGKPFQNRVLMQALGRILP